MRRSAGPESHHYAHQGIGGRFTHLQPKRGQRFEDTLWEILNQYSINILRGLLHLFDYIYITHNKCHPYSLWPDQHPDKQRQYSTVCSTLSYYSNLLQRAQRSSHTLQPCCSAFTLAVCSWTYSKIVDTAVCCLIVVWLVAFLFLFLFTCYTGLWHSVNLGSHCPWLLGRVQLS